MCRTKALEPFGGWRAWKANTPFEHFLSGEVATSPGLRHFLAACPPLSEEFLLAWDGSTNPPEFVLTNHRLWLRNSKTGAHVDIRLKDVFGWESGSLMASKVTLQLRDKTLLVFEGLAATPQQDLLGLAVRRSIKQHEWGAIPTAPPSQPQAARPAQAGGTTMLDGTLSTDDVSGIFLAKLSEPRIGLPFSTLSIIALAPTLVFLIIGVIIGQGAELFATCVGLLLSGIFVAGFRKQFLDSMGKKVDFERLLLTGIRVKDETLEVGRMRAKAASIEELRRTGEGLLTDVSWKPLVMLRAEEASVCLSVCRLKDKYFGLEDIRMQSRASADAGTGVVSIEYSPGFWSVISKGQISLVPNSPEQNTYNEGLLRQLQWVGEFFRRTGILCPGFLKVTFLTRTTNKFMYGAMYGAVGALGAMAVNDIRQATLDERIKSGELVDKVFSPRVKAVIEEYSMEIVFPR
jgi:hypothetical protein